MSAPVKVRYWVRKRDGYICSRCERENSKSVHHIIPVAYAEENLPEFKFNQPSNLVVLCLECHRIIHPGTIEKKVGRKVIFWKDKWDKMLARIALRRSRRFAKKIPPPYGTPLRFCYLPSIEGW